MHTFYAQDLIEVLCAAHLSAFVREGGFDERGGIMLVAPAGALKSTFLTCLETNYPDVLGVTDLNAKALAALRERISSERVRTLVFPEYAKLYERKADTSANLEGSLRALASEGYRSAAFEPQDIARVTAKAMVIGAMTLGFRDTHIQRWQESGFARRFLWPLFVLRRPEILDEAVAQWQRVDFQIARVPHAPPFGETIPMDTTEAERRQLRQLVRYQPGDSSVQQHALLVKILAVLRWWYQRSGNGRDAMEVVQAFGVSLGRDGARLDLEPRRPLVPVKRGTVPVRKRGKPRRHK